MPWSIGLLLATLPGKQHRLELLMAEALLCHSGTQTLNLGTGVPMDQIIAGVDRMGMSTVALSFSASYPRGPIRSHLVELCDRLPRGVAVWIGAWRSAGVTRQEPARDARQPDNREQFEMNDPLLEVQRMEEESTTVGEKLERTHSRAMATMSFSLRWQSENARHTDCLVANKLNLWRDILPPEMEPDLMNKPVSHVASHAFAAGDLLTTYREQDCLRVPRRAFNRNLRKCYIEPRAGRFYPKGFIGGVRGIFPEDLTPFRVAEVAEDGLTVDLNHPLARHALDLEARILDIWAGRDEHGGACHDVAEMVTENSPGMQARWRGQETDFFSDIPFARLDPSPDASFYEKPRMVHHLDATALSQIEGLYRRLLPKGARILDLMSSWTSHLGADLAPARVTGLGMNAQELDANPLLSERLVHDLNLDPRLPVPDQAFDAAICTVSVEYLTKPAEIFAEVCRVLRPGGRFVVTFSDRWFPPKVIKVWQDVHEFERVGLVLEYFLRDGGFTNLGTWSIRGLPRPDDDKYADRMAHSDPVYAVWGERAS
ncbi:MAG: methyltransferase domain-containing protein [Pseudomonadota bacterium]|nr:methyltransferase domain-containing protein [Pseudomonadota bacterium]